VPVEGISILGAVLDGPHLFRYDDLQRDLSIGSNVLLLTSSELDVVLLKSALDVPGSILQNRPKGSPANKYATSREKSAGCCIALDSTVTAFPPLPGRFCSPREFTSNQSTHFSKF
jgi:hypothetical protein